MAKVTIRLFTLLIVLRKIGSMLIIGVYSIYLHEHGLSLLEINLINSVYFLTMLLLELPTGAIADVFGRKKAFLLSSFFCGLGFITYGMSNEISEFIVSEALIATGSTFESGSFKAWLVDRLHHFGNKDADLNTIFSKAGRLGIGLGAISSIVGAKALAIWSPLPWIIAGSLFFLSGFIACFLMKEEYFIPTKHSLITNLCHSIKMIKSGFSSAISNKSILWLFSLGLVGCISVQAINMQWPILFKPHVGNNNVNIGSIGALISLSLAAGSGIAPGIKQRFKNEQNALVCIQVGIGACIILSIVFFKPYFALPMFFIHEVLRGSFQPLKDSYLHKSITNKERRATISSFESISNHIGSIIGLVLSGLWVESNSIQSTWIISGSFLIVITMVLLGKNIKTFY